MPGELTKTQPTGTGVRRRLPRFLRGLFFKGLRVYLVLLLLMMLLENKLIFPAPRYPVGDWEPMGLEFEDVYMTSADGTKLHGWYLDHPEPKAHLLFCHGNGEHVAYTAPGLQYLRDEFDVAVLAFDYRGYGRSEGSPNEPGVLADGQAAHAWLAARAEIDPDQVLLMGRSLGGAVAIDLAATNGARGLIVESSFPSLPDVAARIYWWAPIRLLMRTQLDSAEKIKRYRGPFLQCHGTSDELIPLALAKQLFEVAPAPDKRFVELPGLGHNEWLTPEYSLYLQQFLDELPVLSI
jgi:hypothetical protein